MDYDHCFIKEKDKPQNPETVAVCDFSDCSRRRVTFSLVMFMYSFLTIGNLAYYSLLKDQLHLDPAELNTYYTFINILFIIKPVYGFFTDSCYILGRRRQPYIIIGGVFTAAMWMLVAYVAKNAILATLFMFLINGALALVNSACQALVVEDSRLRRGDQPEGAPAEEKRNEPVTYSDTKAVNNVSLFFLVDSIGLIISSYLSGLMVDAFSLKTTFFVAASVPAMIALCGFALRESMCVGCNRAE